MLTFIRPAVYKSVSDSSDASKDHLGNLIKTKEARAVDLPEDEWVKVDTADELDAEATDEPDEWYRILMA